MPSARHFTGQGVDSCSGGASSGRNRTLRITVPENSTAIMMPGRMPAMNRSPIEVSVMTPYRIIGTLGGMRIPSVPPAAVVPSASDLS